MKPVIRAAALVAALLPLASHAQPVTQAEAAAFFKRMAEMNAKFDSRYPELYSPDATVIGHKGAEKTVVTGAQWQQLLAFGAEKAKRNNNKSTFSMVTVTVKPGSKKGPLVEAADDGSLTVYVRERAVEGKATEAVRRLLADHLGVPRSRVELVSGATSRTKRFRIS